jgi:hypothetical protein
MSAVPLNLLVAGAAFLIAASAAAGQPAGGRIVDAADFTDAASPALQLHLRAQTNRNIVELLRAGRLLRPAALAATNTDLQWAARTCISNCATRTAPWSIRDTVNATRRRIAGQCSSRTKIRTSIP